MEYDVMLASIVWNKKLVVATGVNLLVWDKLGFSTVILTFVTDSLGSFIQSG